MDPITAFANVATALLNFATKLVEGQTPEQKAKIWEWYIADVERLRMLLKLD